MDVTCLLFVPLCKGSKILRRFYTATRRRMTSFSSASLRHEVSLRRAGKQMKSGEGVWCPSAPRPPPSPCSRTLYLPSPRRCLPVPNPANYRQLSGSNPYKAHLIGSDPPSTLHAPPTHCTGNDNQSFRDISSLTERIETRTFTLSSPNVFDTWAYRRIQL